ncbi:MAG: DUF167 domain-containing protein [Bryobacterales bacterium]|nr:DUF167 domain-containing protein [Bryobacterales bacterium]
MSCIVITVAVRVKPGAKADSVEPRPDGSLLIQVKAPPVDGKANEAVVALLAKHFGVKRSGVILKRGASSRNKLFEVAAPSGPS